MKSKATESTSGHSAYTPAKIQYHLKLAGITQAQIARELGVSEMSVSDVVNFRKISARIMRAVSSKIGADHRDVFAWYYRQTKARRSKRAA